MVVYGLGIPNAAPKPDLVYQVARALQDAAPKFLAYSPFRLDQGADGLRRQWGQLDIDQAAMLAQLLTLHLRPGLGSSPSAVCLG